ncbi:hypothetical protein ACNO7O_09565 [Bisgaard Taxon 45]
MMTMFIKEKHIIYKGKEYIAPDWVRYVVTQPTGEVYGFKEKPSLKSPPSDYRYWNPYDHGWDLDDIQFIRLSACKDWRDSLEYIED